MDYILGFFKFISDLGATVMMPIIMLVLGLILGAPFGKSLRAGLTVGVGFVGLNLVTGLLGGSLGPVVQAMVKTYGLTLDSVDIGWVASAAIAFASKSAHLSSQLVLLSTLSCWSPERLKLLTLTFGTTGICIYRRFGAKLNRQPDDGRCCCGT